MPHESLSVASKKQHDERGHGSLREGIARGDIYLVHLVGNAMDDGLKQPLVAHHDSRAASVSHPTALAEPGSHVARLNVLGGGADIADVLVGIGQVVVDVVVVHVELVGEGFEVLGDVVASLGHIGSAGVISVKVPVESGLALLHESPA